MSWLVIISTILILGGSIFVSKPQPDTSVIGLEEQLYKPPKINSFKKENIKQEYQQIPDVNDYLDLLESNLEFKFDKKNKMGPVFALIAGEARTGKTFAVQKLAERLISNDISQTMYIDLKNSEDQENIEKLLKNINYLPFYDWLNKKHENPPTIIIDHFEKANQEDYTYSSKHLNFLEFCELKIDSWSKKYELNEETKKVAKFILEYQKQFSVENDNKQVNYVNQWVSYGFLKHKLNNDYKILDQAISLGLEYALFEQQPGQIRFFGKLAQTSALENEISEIKQVNYEIKKKEL
ncbi:P-loop containing nucleoside triphosphate hydrolase [Pseudocohnilembus persalinus]|uniref:p-loop containing nucleoside triphosphate hydrolase n=1 Tax=Pseudocohnilembus persalinus TaxID=266149 RepID=A0A0V0R9Q5_PSEPJ|nr:P-loop containing nucleoside triphosphate hydrolase [Pseudocohnilembus persalinus]|eukprot:KRX11223.1 P-loop containing nucleoside triphosphate hydrolase [Pseudocohnilembus persalinus]